MEILLLLLSFFLFLFLPGWAFLALIFKNKLNFLSLRGIVFSLGFSLLIVDSFVLLINFIGLKINFFSISIIPLVAGIFLIFNYYRKKSASTKIKESYSEKQIYWIVLLLFVFSLTIRFFYLSDKTFPTATDLGHHLYWIKHIQTFGNLPHYDGMPDFIIGEHIIFAVIAIFSKINLLSALPICLLTLFNFFSFLTIIILAEEIFSSLLKNPLASRLLALISGLIAGVLYSISTPQSKFISGGVIGNTLGNFLIPLTFIFFLRFIKNKNEQRDFIFFLLFAALLSYTHHLSALVFALSLGGFILGSFIFAGLTVLVGRKDFSAELFSKIKASLNWKTLIFFVSYLLFLFVIYTPTYLNKSAIDIAIGDPIKETRTGYSLAEINDNIGNWRFSIASIGFFLLITVIAYLVFEKKLKEKKVLKLFQFLDQLGLKTNDSVISSFSILLLIFWFLMLFIASNSPELFKVDIPSRRIITYLTFSTSILASFTIFIFFSSFQFLFKNTKITALVILALLGTGFFDGLNEIDNKTITKTSHSLAAQVYIASAYLAKVSTPEEKILKDHIYLSGDTFSKLFLMRGYNEPLSRSYLQRYNDPTKPRETCTRDMIAQPESEIGKACFEKTGVKYILLKKDRGTASFEKSDSFSKIFSTQETVIYKLNEN